MRKIICLFSLLLVAATANAQNSTYQDKDTEWLKKSIAEQKKREDAEANRLKKALKLDALEKDKKEVSSYISNAVRSANQLISQINMRLNNISRSEYGNSPQNSKCH